MKIIKYENLNRRKFMKAVGGPLVAAPFLGLLGCNGSDGNNGTGLTDEEVINEIEKEVNNDITTDVSGKDWASGGTASISVDFPPADPFSENLGSVCKATSSYTLGPCYFSPDEYREDISEGELGVPLILCLKVVDQNCQPVAGVDVDIWHCNSEGIYSGDAANSSDSSSFRTPFCTGNDTRALASRWFRGVQKTNSSGLVFFKTCFPGWYPRRTTHIHFKIVDNGKQYLVSQFCFEDNLSNDIYLNHGDYTGIAKDTSNSSDSIFGSDYEDYAFYIKKNADNSMLAYKTIQLTA